MPGRGRRGGVPEEGHTQDPTRKDERADVERSRQGGSNGTGEGRGGGREDENRPP